MYLIFFGVGVGFVVLTLILGNFLESDVTALSFFKPKLIAVFLTVTGGVGLLLTPRFYGMAGDGIVLAISVSGGFLIASLINIFVIKPLHRAQNTSTFNKQDAVGQLAEVVALIPCGGGYGKIRYSISGSVVTGAAKSEDESEIRIGENAEITRVEGSTYFVKKQADFSSQEL